MIAAILNILLGITVMILCIPVMILLVQIICAIIYRAKPKNWSALKRPSIVVLMPAHNESLVIAKPIEAILKQLTHQDRLLVVADNCTDDTADIARGLGAGVVERSHQELRGKGYALDFGCQHLRESPPEVVIIIDADCMVAEGVIGQLAKACISEKRPIQALYLMESPLGSSLKMRVAEFAWHVKNKVRPLGAKTLNLPCQLMGTGMAFLWQDLCNINLATGHIVEDMKMGVDLARLNKAPSFLPEALVTSSFPVSEHATTSQRTRWEHGHLGLIFSEVPKLMIEAIRAGNFQMLGMACDLLIPPLTMLVMLCLATFLVCVFLATKMVFFLSGIMLVALLVAVLSAWIFFGQGVISFKELCYVPMYILAKIPLYIKFFINRQKEWIRSDRD
jgi:cellulose synthase/poly-beta-1,6-N-acetylglucosamine synthase-like glycosyltransferase